MIFLWSSIKKTPVYNSTNLPSFIKKPKSFALALNVDGKEF